MAPDGRTNYAAVGYDLLSERARTRAVTLARDTNPAVTTTPVRLVQGPEASGFIIMLPAYQPGHPDADVERAQACLRPPAEAVCDRASEDPLPPEASAALQQGRASFAERTA